MQRFHHNHGVLASSDTQVRPPVGLSRTVLSFRNDTQEYAPVYTGSNHVREKLAELNSAGQRQELPVQVVETRELRSAATALRSSGVSRLDY